MPVWSEDEFISRAKLLAREHTGAKVPLNDLVEKVARANDLSPDAIRTLGRLTNVAVFQEMFAQKTAASADDRMVQFEPGDPEVVIGRIVKPGASEKVASVWGTVSYEIPDLVTAAKYAGVEVEKVASEDVVERAAPRQLEVMRLRKFAQELEVEICKEAALWEASIDALTAAFRKAPGYGPAYASFEKEALASEGEAVRIELDVLRDSLRMGPLNVTREKVASLQERHLVTDSKELSILKEARAHREAYSTLRRAQGAVSTRLIDVK